MKIPLPCKFGELSDCDGKLLPLCGVHWFDWMSGRQYTYFFETGDQWHPYTFYETRQEQQPFSMEIPDDLLSDGLIKEKGYPLRGAGKVLGVDYRDGKLLNILTQIVDRHNGKDLDPFPGGRAAYLSCVLV